MPPVALLCQSPKGTLRCTLALPLRLPETEAAGSRPLLNRLVFVPWRCHPQVVVLNGCASLFSALATVLCEAGGKWTVAHLALGAALCLQRPQLPAPKGCIRMLSAVRLLYPRGLKEVAS